MVNNAGSRMFLDAFNGGGTQYPFTKDTIADLFAWWDFSDSSTISKTGNDVTAVTDKTGFGSNHTLSPYLTVYPQYVAADQNGLSGIRVGTSATMVLYTPQFTGGTEPDDGNTTIFFVTKPNSWSASDATDRALFCGWGGGGNITQQLTKKVSSTDALMKTYNIGYDVTGITQGSAQILTCQFNAASSIFARNKEANQTGTTQDFTVCYRMTFGAYDQNINLWTCDETMYEFLYFKRILTAAEMTYCKNYLAEKWGI